MRMLGACGVLFGVMAVVAACSAPGDDGGESEDGALAAAGATDLPWEVRTREGELVLPNVFYADASETEQMMSTKVHGRWQIDRLVYPTIGNPNLYVRSDKNDAALAVLRIEESMLAHLGPHWDGAIAGSPLRAVSFDTQDDKNGVFFFLVARGARAAAEAQAPATAKNGVFPVKPSGLVAHPIVPGMPAAFAARRTLRAEFDGAALANVPAGLYDIRFEVRKGGALVASEFQYNAVRIFDKAASDYSVVNVTDTQVTVGTAMERLTLPHLKEFVQRVNVTTDPEVRNAAFITFNGDLHNGGSADVLLPETVSNDYRVEAETILDTLKDLNLPIFLTAGNHDGYVSMGHALPGIETVALLTLQNNVKDAVRESRPELSAGDFDKLWATFDSFRNATADQPGGRHVDVFNGKFTRAPVADADRSDPTKAFATWKPVDSAKANIALYDGQNEWRRVYGPLYASWDFGKTRFVNMNTYELRQHRRAGWGMYTVNYGGGMSRVQAAFVEQEVGRAEKDGRDVVLIGHHDPRGGHNGMDYPYQFGLIEYKPGVSSYNYVMGEIYNKYACEGTLDWVRAGFAKLGLVERELSCLHDGLQEWMRADEFDCAESNPRDKDGKCIVDASKPGSDANRLWSSAFSLIHKLATHKNVRTVLLGHTHYNSLEVLESGDEIVPGKVVLDADQEQALETLEFATTLRSSSAAQTPAAIVKQGTELIEDLAKAGNDFHRTVEGDARELVILRSTSSALLTDQKVNGKPMYGYATLHVSAKTDARNYATPQINSVTFFVNDQNGSFESVKKLDLDRTKRIRATDKDNPVNAFFTL